MSSSQHQPQLPQPTSSGTLPRIHLNLQDSSSSDESKHNSQDKLKLYNALQHYLAETNQLESLLKNHLEMQQRQTLTSSPEFGKHKAKTGGGGFDIQNLIEEIEKRKDGLSSLQDMLLYSKKGANDENNSEKCNRSTEIMTTEGNDDLKEIRGKQVQVQMIQETNQGFGYEQRIGPGNKLKAIIKKLQVKHLQDLLPIKKPLPFVMKACQLFSLLHFSMKKEFDPKLSIGVFTEWNDINKYLIASPRVYQDIQMHIKHRIENLEYNYDFVSLLLKEYQCHEKLFTYNRLQTSEATNIILQLFLTCIEYITFFEELRVHGRYNDYIKTLRKKGKVIAPPQIITSVIQPLTIQQHMQQVQNQIQRQSLHASTNKILVRPQTAQLNSSRTRQVATKILRTESSQDNRNSTGRINKDLIIQSFQSQKVFEQRNSLGLSSQKSASQLLSIKNQKVNISTGQSERSDSNKKKERRSATPMATTHFQNRGGTRFDYKPVIHSSKSPNRVTTNREVVPSPMSRIIQAQQKKQLLATGGVRSKSPISQPQQQQHSSIKNQEQVKNEQIIQQYVDNTTIGSSIKVIDDQFSLRGSPNKSASNKNCFAHQKHLSQLNIEFSFCSDGNGSSTSKMNKDGSQMLRPVFEIADNKAQPAINIFTNRIVLQEEYKSTEKSPGMVSQASQTESPYKQDQDVSSQQYPGDFILDSDIDSKAMPLFKLNIPPISPKGAAAVPSSQENDSQNNFLKFKSPTSESQKRNAQTCLSSQNRYKIQSKCESEENLNKEGGNHPNPMADSQDDENYPATLQKTQIEHGIKAVLEEGANQGIAIKIVSHTQHNNKNLELTDSQKKKMYIGDFTYKEKYAVENMIQQLEKELFKSKYSSHSKLDSAKQFDSRPQD